MRSILLVGLLLAAAVAADAQILPRRRAAFSPSSSCGPNGCTPSSQTPTPRPDTSKATAPDSSGADQRDKGYLFGVDLSKLSSEEQYELDGTPCSRQKVLKAMADSRLKDDTNKYHMTVISSNQSLVKKFLDDWQSSPLFRDFKDKLLVQIYDPSNPVDKIMLADLKLDSDERYKQKGMMFSFQAPKDKSGESTVMPVYGYAGPEHLAQCMAAIYDPAKNKELSPTLPVSANHMVLIGMAGAVVLLFLLKGGE